jgi:hypothetical protein
MARPSLLRDELREQIGFELAEEMPIALVAQHAGVARSTLFEWIRLGYVERRRRRDPLTLVQESPAESTTSTSPADLDERLRAAAPGLVASIVRASQRGSRQAAAWLLERIEPARAWRSRRALRSREAPPRALRRTSPDG